MHETGIIVAHCEICKKGFHTKQKASNCRRQHVRSGNFKISEEISTPDKMTPRTSETQNPAASSLSALLLDNH